MQNKMNDDFLKSRENYKLLSYNNFYLQIRWENGDVIYNYKKIDFGISNLFKNTAQKYYSYPPMFILFKGCKYLVANIVFIPEKKII